MTRSSDPPARRGRVSVAAAVALVALAAILMALAILVRSFAAWQQRPVQPVITSAGPTIERLEALQELTVQKVHVSDVMEYRNGWKAAWLVKGDGLISIPLKDARIVDVDQEHRTARIVLPQPRVLTARVDHEKTLHYDSKEGTWNKMKGFGGGGEAYPDVNARAMKEMQRLVDHAIGLPEHLDEARDRAALALKALYMGIEWNVSVDWVSDPEPVPPGPDPAAPKPTG